MLPDQSWKLPTENRIGFFTVKAISFWIYKLCKSVPVEVGALPYFSWTAQEVELREKITTGNLLSAWG